MIKNPNIFAEANTPISSANHDKGDAPICTAKENNFTSIIFDGDRFNPNPLDAILNNFCEFTYVSINENGISRWTANKDSVEYNIYTEPNTNGEGDRILLFTETTSYVSPNIHRGEKTIFVDNRVEFNYNDNCDLETETRTSTTTTEFADIVGISSHEKITISEEYRCGSLSVAEQTKEYSHFNSSCDKGSYSVSHTITTYNNGTEIIEKSTQSGNTSFMHTDSCEITRETKTTHIGGNTNEIKETYRIEGSFVALNNRIETDFAIDGAKIKIRTTEYKNFKDGECHRIETITDSGGNVLCKQDTVLPIEDVPCFKGKLCAYTQEFIEQGNVNDRTDWETGDVGWDEEINPDTFEPTNYSPSISTNMFQ